MLRRIFEHEYIPCPERRYPSRVVANLMAREWRSMLLRYVQLAWKYIVPSTKLTPTVMRYIPTRCTLLTRCWWATAVIPKEVALSRCSLHNLNVLSYRHHSYNLWVVIKTSERPTCTNGSFPGVYGTLHWRFGYSRILHVDSEVPTYKRSALYSSAELTT